MNDYCPFIIYIFCLMLDFCVLILFKWKITAKPHIVSPGLPSMELEPRAAEHGFGRQGGGPAGAGFRLPAALPDSPRRPARAQEPMNSLGFGGVEKPCKTMISAHTPALALARIRGGAKRQGIPYVFDMPQTPSSSTPPPSSEL